MECTDQEPASGVTIDNLPHEILRMILPPRVSTLLTCRRWRVIVQPVLIAKITRFVTSNALRRGPYAKSLREIHECDQREHTVALNKILDGTGHVCFFKIEATGAALEIYENARFTVGPVYVLRYNMYDTTFEAYNLSYGGRGVWYDVCLEDVADKMKHNREISVRVDEFIARLRHIYERLGLEKSNDL